MSAPDPFRDLPEQAEAKRLLGAALAEGPAHAYLLHGPRGVGKRAAALAFAGAILHDRQRTERRTHPDLYVLEPLGEQIRIDDIHALRHDLHLRPFEADRRVYLVLGADLMNDDASDALLKSLEEPPPYAVVVLVADRLAPVPDTIRSRCQSVPFRRLSRQAVAARLSVEHPELGPAEAASIARLAAGRLDRAERLADPERAAVRDGLLDLARAVYRDPSFEAQRGARQILDVAAARAERARARVREQADDSLTPRELEQRERRAGRAAEREEIVEALDVLASWYRDLLVVGAGATGAAMNGDRLAQLVEDAEGVGSDPAARAVEAVLDTRRTFELQVQAGLALDALLVRLGQALAPLGAGAPLA